MRCGRWERLDWATNVARGGRMLRRTTPGVFTLALLDGVGDAVAELALRTPLEEHRSDPAPFR
jgi:hypothetical protein